MTVKFRIAYTTADELAAAVAQVTHGALLVPTTETAEFDSDVELELVMPDGTSLLNHGTVLQVLAGHGVAVTIMPRIADEMRRIAAAPVPTRSPTTPPPTEELSHAQKIQLALHGTRDQRNAILRDKNRMLHAYVLKNPQMNLDDVIAIAKNPTMGADIYKQIAERADWFQKQQVAVALARNPKVPSEIAIRALAYVGPDALRQLAKGVGAPPHVIQAARKKVVDK